VSALEDGEGVVDEMIALCREGRDVVSEHLSACSRVRYRAPDAAFYAFFAVDGVTNSLDYAKELVWKAGVGLAPGTAFGPEGEGWLRLCFARERGSLQKAMERLGDVFV